MNENMLSKLEKKMNKYDVIVGDFYGEKFKVGVKQHILNTDISNCVADITKGVQYGKASLSSILAKSNAFDICVWYMIKNFTDLLDGFVGNVEEESEYIVRNIRCMDNATTKDGETLSSVLIRKFIGGGYFEKINEKILKESAISDEVLKVIANGKKSESSNN